MNDKITMQKIFAAFLLLCLIACNFRSHVNCARWGVPPGQTFVPPGHTFVPPGHSFQPPGRTFQSYGPPTANFPGFGPGPGTRGPPNYNWYAQQQQGGNVIDMNTADWVCRNPKTGDIIIFATEEGAGNANTGKAPQNEGWSSQNGRWPSQNGGRPNQNGQNPIIGNPNNENVQNLPTPVTNSPTAKQTDATESTSQHGGEGLIDVRIGNR